VVEPTPAPRANGHATGYGSVPAAPDVGGPLRAIGLAELAGMDFPPIEWAVEGIVAKGSLNLLVGRPKAGKSLLAVDLVVSIARGDDYLGRATTPGPAVYVPAEDALPLVAGRLWTRLADPADPGDPADPRPPTPDPAVLDAPVWVVPVDGSLDQRLLLDDPVSFAALADLVTRLRPAVLVLDPMVEMHRLAEKNADEMAMLLRPLRQLAHASGCAIVVVHHRNKHAADGVMAARGSSAITGGVDTVISATLSGDEDDDEDDQGMTPQRTMTLAVEGRYGPRRTLHAQLRPGLRWHPAPRPQKAQRERSNAREVFRSEPLPERLTRHLAASRAPLGAADLAEATGITTNRAQHALTELVADGRARRWGAGTRADPYRYSLPDVPGPTGQAVLSAAKDPIRAPPDRPP
jgi:hypothetical protein